MRILLLNWQDIKNPAGGGAEVHMHEIFKRIVARGHSVTLFCSSFSGAPSEETIDGIRIIRHGSRNLFNYFVPFYYYSQFHRERYDIVVDDINKIPFYTPLFVKEPLLGIVHHLFGKSIFVEASLPAALYVHSAERCLFPIYRNIPLAVVSESTKQELISKGFHENNISIISNAIDHTLYRQIEIVKNSKLIVGNIGRIKKYKSIDHLLKAFQIVLKTMPETKLVIVGDGDAREGLQQLANTLGIGGSASFTGYISPEKKVHWLNQMNVVVNTSSKEGWGLTVIEANACGVPVIASDVPGLHDSVIDGQTGLLYEYGNIEQLAEKILLILRDEHLRARLSAEALTWAHTFNWDDSATKMLALLTMTISAQRLGAEKK